MFFNFKYFRQIYYSIGLLSLIIFGGALGFNVIEGYTVTEAIYMTIITVSTVGFSEIRPLTEAGRIFTSILIISSFGTFAFAITSLTKIVLSGEFRQYLKQYNVNKEIEHLSNHVIVCGYGRNGQQAVETLLLHKQKVVVIEKNSTLIPVIKDNSAFIVIEGDATDENLLVRAGILRAKSLITTLPKDADNVFVVLSVRELNKSISIISRASELSSDKKLRFAGANNVIMPDKVGGAHMASLVVTPDVMEFLDMISVQGRHSSNLEEVVIRNLEAKLQGKSIKDFEMIYQTGARIIGVKTLEGSYIINPSPNYTIRLQDKFFAIGTKDQIAKMQQVFN